MKTKLQSTKIFLSVLSLFILGCRLLSDGIATPVDTDANPDQQPTESQTATLPPTVAPTATVYPPVFDPEAIGDNRVLLDSFILTNTEKTTGGGEVDTRQDTTGYIKEPFSAYHVLEFSITSDETFVHKKYWIGDWSYETNGVVDWMILLGADPEGIDAFLQLDADMLGAPYISDVLSAQFVGQEDFQGVPANHFTFDQTNLGRYEIEPGDDGYKIEAAQGDLYLAQDGNYPLYFHVKLTGNLYDGPGSPVEYFPGVYEVTEELSSINQLTEIAVPAEYLEPEQTLLDLDLPLPAGTTLVAMRRFGSSGWDTYGFATSVSNDEFLEFYENLAPTSGWTVSHIGQVTYHYPCSDLDQVCVIINKGDVQFILDYYEGGISADYDREHVFSPQ